MIKLYLANTAALDVNSEQTISQYRQTRLNAAGSLIKRQESLGAELLLNLAIKEAVPGFIPPANIITDENGKPELCGIPLCFSLSHSDGFAACAVADVPLGLDIEKQSPVREKVLRRVFSFAEQDYVLSHPEPDYAFTKLWVLKESVVKQNGRGIGQLLNRVEVLNMKGLWHAVKGEYHMALYCPEESELEVEIQEIKLTQS